MVPAAVEWVAKLRRAGRSADGDLLGRSLSRQLKEASRRFEAFAAPAWMVAAR